MKKKKKRLKLKKIWIFIFLLIGGILLYNFGNFEIFKNKNVDTKTSEKKEEKEIYPKVSKISLVATGDGLLHNAVYLDAYDKSTNTFDFSNQLTMVEDIISSYDIAYYNQETLFGGKQTDLFASNDAYNVSGYSSYPYFNSPSEFGDAMVDAGFNMVSLASNHSADCTRKSKECITNSYDYWESKDVVFAGFNKDSNNTNNYVIKEKNDIKYTLLNYTYTLNGLDRYISEDAYLVNTYDEEKVKTDILEIKDQVDVIIVAMHWHTGAEYSFTVTEKNKEIAQYLSSLGVDIILGTYSHCLQPFDIINDTVVFYSLGNFISNQGDLINTIGYKGIVGVLASMDITKTEEEDGSVSIKIDNLGADLTYTYNKNHNNYLVIPFSKMNENYNSNYKQIYEDYKSVLTALNDNITVAPLAN